MGRRGVSQNAGILVVLVIFKADFRFAASHWETDLHCNNVSHWLGASLESALVFMLFNCDSNFTEICLWWSIRLVFVQKISWCWMGETTNITWTNDNWYQQYHMPSLGHAIVWELIIVGILQTCKYVDKIWKSSYRFCNITFCSW